MGELLGVEVVKTGATALTFADEADEDPSSGTGVDLGVG